MKKLEISLLSSLSKVFPQKIYGEELTYAEIALGQSFSFQVTLCGDKAEYTYEINSIIKDYIAVYSIGCVPMTTPAYESCQDEDYLTKERGMCPDPLFPQKDNRISVGEEYTTLWFTASLPKNFAAGKYNISVSILENGQKVGEKSFDLKVHDISLPEQELIFTQWFHTDCIADVHGVEVFSEEHWALIEKYISVATSHGMNMLLIPVLTPPLDTEVGGERTTVQLVKIEKNGDNYLFEFSRLERFIDICLKCGVKYFEINHMFTQWGAKNAPKVIATVGGEEKRIFGWETDATSQEYVEFLNQLIPSIIDVFDKKEIERSRIYFHVSDEPGESCIVEYEKAYRVLEGLINGCQQVDALSHFGFYEKGIIKTPIVAIDSIEPFLEAQIKDLWCYYCCSQHEQVSNRFFAMPSYRTRIIGVQMYKCSIVGFLHWGYNFYNLQFSKGKINPYEVTDAGGSFPSGDSFSVYPHENSATPSLRMKVFKNAIEDISLLKALEKKIGKAEVNALIDRVAGMEITFKSYPKNEKFFERLYSEIFNLLNK